jgi:predicted nucleotidyltransferase component of viral defense system
VYPLEFIFAEKLQTLLERGSSNSRAKDVYDLVEIFPRCDVAHLVDAVQRVFENRKTPLPDSISRAVKSIDTAVLERSWASIDFATDAPRFKDYWSRLQTSLRALDVGAEAGRKE